MHNTTDNTTNELKQMAAQAALAYVQNGMVLGLGTGSTTRIFIDLLGEGWQQGVYRDLRCVPTSEASAAQARAWQLPLIGLDDVRFLDLAVDGADEVDPALNLIKGLGKALLREKLVEVHARRLVIIVDETKLVQRLGQHVPLPVEVTPFGALATLRWLQDQSTRAELWRADDGSLLRTDNGNYYARCWFAGGIPDPEALARQLNAWPGVVENGLFLNMATDVLIATSQGLQILERNS